MQIVTSSILTNDHYENLELRIKKDQEQFRKEQKPHVLAELRNITENAFMMPKSKKENFITREKIVLDILRLLQSQKRFKPSENIYSNIRWLAAVDRTDKEIGKIISLNLDAQTVEFQTWSDKLNSRPNRVKGFSEVDLFDYNSMAMQVVHADYCREFQTGLNFLEMYNFLTKKDCKPKEESTFKSGYGVEVRSEDSIPLKEVIEAYGIPDAAIKKIKRKIFRLDISTMEVLEEYETVKQAAELLGISASVISNVLCQGPSAMKYLDAGGFRWSYSDKPNIKYAAQQTSGNNFEYNLHLD